MNPVMHSHREGQIRQFLVQSVVSKQNVHLLVLQLLHCQRYANVVVLEHISLARVNLRIQQLLLLLLHRLGLLRPRFPSLHTLWLAITHPPHPHFRHRRLIAGSITKTTLGSRGLIHHGTRRTRPSPHDRRHGLHLNLLGSHRLGRSPTLQTGDDASQLLSETRRSLGVRRREKHDLLTTPQADLEKEEEEEHQRDEELRCLARSHDLLRVAVLAAPSLVAQTASYQ